jgi:uncharacterized protein YbjQ (UPF0145 family)
VAYLSCLHLALVREAPARTLAPGRLGAFQRALHAEVNAVAAAQAAALGGNAILGYRVRVVESAARGAYQLVTVVGDVAVVEPEQGV